MICIESSETSYRADHSKVRLHDGSRVQTAEPTVQQREHDTSGRCGPRSMAKLHPPAMIISCLYRSVTASSPARVSAGVVREDGPTQSLSREALATGRLGQQHRLWSHQHVPETRRSVERKRRVDNVI